MREAFRRGWRDAYTIERTRSRFGFCTSMHMSLRLAEREQELHQKSRSEAAINTLGLWIGSAWQSIRYTGRTFFPKPTTEIIVMLPTDTEIKK